MTYKIEYETEDLRVLCEQMRPDQPPPLAIRKLGKAGAKKLARRVKNLETSADSVELRQGPGDWHPISYDWPGCLGGELQGAATIIVKSITTASGQPGWRVMCVGDCYKH